MRARVLLSCLVIGLLLAGCATLQQHSDDITTAGEVITASAPAAVMVNPGVGALLAVVGPLVTAIGLSLKG